MEGVGFIRGKNGIPANSSQSLICFLVDETHSSRIQARTYFTDVLSVSVGCLSRPQLSGGLDITRDRSKNTAAH